MPIDYEDKPPAPYEPNSIVKKAEIATDTAMVTTGISCLPSAVKNSAPMRRHAIRQVTKTIKVKAEQLDAQTSVIRADTNQKRALQENAQARIDSARFSPEHRQADIILNDKLAGLDRQETIEAREHRLKMAQQQRMKESHIPPESMGAEERERRRVENEEKKTVRVKAEWQREKDYIRESFINGVAGPITQETRRSYREMCDKNYGGVDGAPEDVAANYLDALERAKRKDKGSEF